MKAENELIGKQEKSPTSVSNQMLISKTLSASFYAELRERTLYKFKNNAYDQLKTAMDKWFSDKKVLEEFFSREGEIILHYGLIKDTTEPLRFLFKHIPHSILQKIFANDNYVVLKRFLMGESGIERSKFYTEHFKQNQIEKLKLLCKSIFQG